MASGNLERLTFIRGLITEASALTFPENASIAEDNFVLSRDGSRHRRFGMDYEALASVVDTGKTSLTFDDFYIGSEIWQNVNNDGTISFGMIQIGNEIWVVDLFATTLSLAIKNSGVSIKLDTTTIGYTVSGLKKISMAAVNGGLVITSPEFTLPVLLKYNQQDDEFILSDTKLLVRDIWGVYDSMNVDERPATIVSDHKYNLLNQGWKDAQITKEYTGVTGSIKLKQKYPAYYKASDGTPRYPTTLPVSRGGRGGRRASYVHVQAVKIYDKWGNDGEVSVAATGLGYPSNADVASVGKKADGTFDKVLITGSFFGTTPAAKGKYVIDAFERGADRELKSGQTGLELDKETARPAVVESYANRMFYSGIDGDIHDPTETSPDYTGTILFSQTIENFAQLGKCYQDADPTSDETSALLPTDGGTIKIAGASLIIRMIATSRSLLVFAENGVWEVTGPDGVFRADDFSINKISNIGAVSADSIVDAEGQIYYWSQGGIYNLQSDQVSGRLNAVNITESTIQTYYNNIPTVGKANVVGNYDPASRKIRWMYNDTDGYTGIKLKNKYNRELILDTVLKAFYSSTIGSVVSNTPYVAGFVLTERFVTEEDSQAVVHNGEQVQVNGVDVVVTQRVRSRGDSQTKYLTIKPNASGSNYGITFSHHRDIEFLDWKTSDSTGVDSPAFLVTGFELFQDTQRKKQINYLTMHFKRTETGFTDTGGGMLEPKGTSSCMVQARWDFADNNVSGKFGTKFQAYRLNRFFLPTGPDDIFEYGQEVISTKNRLRGRGKAISLRIESEPKKDMILLGWAMAVEGQTRV